MTCESEAWCSEVALTSSEFVEEILKASEEREEEGMTCESETRCSEVAFSSSEFVEEVLEEVEGVTCESDRCSEVALTSSEFFEENLEEVERMTCKSEPRCSEVALTSSKFVEENLEEEEGMTCEIEARCSEVDLTSSQFAEENLEESRISYTLESLLSLSEADICKELPDEVDQSTIRELRISYTREDLLSLAGVNACKELPDGFDRSTVSDMQDDCKSGPEIQELHSHESVSSSGFCGASSQAPERLDASKSITSDSSYKSEPDVQKLQIHESLSDTVGRMSGISSEESEERWDRFKLTSADSNSTAVEKCNWSQLRRPWKNPSTTGIWRSPSLNSEQSSVLGSWSGPKPSSAGSELSILELPGSDCRLSRCSQPYRPPSYYKAINHPETQKHDLHSNKTSGHAEGPNKQRATEESWRKDSFDFKTKDPPQAIQEKAESHGRDEKVFPRACIPLEDHSALQVVSRFTSAPPIFPAVSTFVEPPCTTPGTAEDCLTEDSLNDQPTLEGQEVIYHSEKLQPHILEGGRFSALMVLEDAEDVDPDLLDEANFAFNDKPRDGQKIISGGMGFSKMEKKGLRTQVALLTKSKEQKTSNIFPNNAVRKAATYSCAVKASLSSEVSMKPSTGTCNSRGGFVAQQEKSFDLASKEMQKGFAEKTSDENQSATQEKVSTGSVSEFWLPSHCTKSQDIIMDSKGSCTPDSTSVHWFSGNDTAPTSFSSWPDLSGNNIWRTSTGMLTKDNLLDKGQSRETSLFAQEVPSTKMTGTAIPECVRFPFVERNNCNHGGNHDTNHARLSELEVPKIRESGHTFEDVTNSQINGGLKFNPMSNFYDEADSNFEINLPDEDSLITVDDTCIFQEDMFSQFPEIPSKAGRRTSPFPGSMQTESLYQNPILPDPWFQDSQLNVAQLFINPSNTRAHVRASPQLHDPWRFCNYNYDPFSSDSTSLGQLPLMPRPYEPPLQDFLSLRVPQTQSFYPHLNITRPAEPPPYHQFHPRPYRPKEPDLLESLPLNYQGNVNSSYVGMRDRHGEEEIRPTFSQILQMQIQMAQMKLGATPGFEQRGYGKTISNRHR